MNSQTAMPPSAGLRLAERLLAIAIFALVIYQLYLSSKVGVTPRGSAAREVLAHTHISLGLTILLLLIPRLLIRSRLPREARPPRITAAADAFARHCTLGFLCAVTALCLTGPLFAWSEGQAVSFWGAVTLPALLDAGYRAQVTLGYLHSMLGFFVIYLAGVCIVTAIWQTVRYRVSPLRMLPGFPWGPAAGSSP